MEIRTSVKHTADSWNFKPGKGQINWPFSQDPFIIEQSNQPTKLTMAAKIKNFLSGLLVGAIIAFPLGINFGKGAPLLSNPFEKRDIKTKVTSKAKNILKGAKESIHEATKSKK